MDAGNIPFKRRIYLAGAWSFVGFALNYALRLGSSLLMTRLLVPEMFGIMSIASMVMFGLALFSDIGLKPSVTQSRRGADPIFLNTVWTIQILRGMLLWSFGILASYIIYLVARYGHLEKSSVYGNPLLPLVIASVSVTGMIQGFESTKLLEAARHLSLAIITKIELCTQLAGLFVMTAYGLAYHSVWALVFGGITSSVVRTILSHVWLRGTDNRIHFERDAFYEIVRFGKWIFLSSILFFFANSGDRLILGGLVDTSSLGSYSVAFVLFSAIDQVLMKIIEDVSFPALSEVIRERPAKLTQTYYKFHLIIASITYFSCGVLSTSAQEIVKFLYDYRYQQAGWILQILSIALLTLPFRMSTQAFLALGIERIYFLLHSIRIATLFGALPLGFYLYGFPGAVWGIVFSYFSNLPLVIKYAARHGIFEPKQEVVTLLAIVPGIAAGKLLMILLNIR
jgi:O-antigen/teichoic acid export membrane protein